MIIKYSELIIAVMFSSLLLYSCAALYDVSETKDENISSMNSGMPSEPGKCYAKCLIQDKYELVVENILVYTDIEIGIEGVELQKFVLSRKTTKWMKIKSNSDCHSTNPEDCLIWSLEDIPEVTEEYYIVTDTNLVKEFVHKTLSRNVLIQAGGFTAWKEVMCQKDVSASLYKKIEIALIEKGFLEYIVPSGKINRETKTGLMKFQKVNNLPLGSLDLETLDLLGVDY